MIDGAVADAEEGIEGRLERGRVRPIGEQGPQAVCGIGCVSGAGGCSDELSDGCERRSFSRGGDGSAKDRGVASSEERLEQPRLADAGVTENRDQHRSAVCDRIGERLLQRREGPAAPDERALRQSARPTFRGDDDRRAYGCRLSLQHDRSQSAQLRAVREQSRGGFAREDRSRLRRGLEPRSRVQDVRRELVRGDLRDVAEKLSGIDAYARLERDSLSPSFVRAWESLQ